MFLFFRKFHGVHRFAIVCVSFCCFSRPSGVLYPKVHCSYQSLGESLMPKGEVDNFIIPCFCRLLFEERHPSSSGRHYFFPNIGVGTIFFRFMR